MLYRYDRARKKDRLQQYLALTQNVFSMIVMGCDLEDNGKEIIMDENGYWSDYTTEIDGDFLRVFEQAMGEKSFVHYTPFAVSMKGDDSEENYHFLCNGELVPLDDTSLTSADKFNLCKPVKISVCKPAGGEPVVTDKSKI